MCLSNSDKIIAILGGCSDTMYSSLSSGQAATYLTGTFYLCKTTNGDQAGMNLAGE